MQMSTFGTRVNSGWTYVITFQWVVGLLSWALTSAGTISEAAFVLAPLWICINASVHPFVLLFLPEAVTKDISYFADTLLVGIPELIALSAIITVIGRVGLWAYQGKKPVSLSAVWVLAFGIPTAVFIVITVLTLWYSFGNVTFQLPLWVVQIRGIAAYWYGLASLLYSRIGRVQEAGRLQQKDSAIAALRAEMDAKLQEMAASKDAVIATIQRENARLQEALDHHKTLLHESIARANVLQSEITQSTEGALLAYGEMVIDWLKGLDKTVEIDEIAARTGISKKRLQGAIEKGELRIRGTNKSRIWVPSLQEYLIKYAPKNETQPALHVVHG